MYYAPATLNERQADLKLSAVLGVLSSNEMLCSEQLSVICQINSVLLLSAFDVEAFAASLRLLSC